MKAHGSAALAIQCTRAWERSLDLLAFAREQVMSRKWLSQGPELPKATVILREVSRRPRPCSQCLSFIGQVTNLFLLHSPSPKVHNLRRPCLLSPPLKFCPLSLPYTSLHIKTIFLKPILTDTVLSFRWLLLH